MHGFTAWKLSKYEVIPSPCIPVFIPNTGKYGPEIGPYLETFHAMVDFNDVSIKQPCHAFYPTNITWIYC